MFITTKHSIYVSLMKKKKKKFKLYLKMVSFSYHNSCGFILNQLNNPWTSIINYVSPGYFIILICSYLCPVKVTALHCTQHFLYYFQIKIPLLSSGQKPLFSSQDLHSKIFAGMCCWNSLTSKTHMRGLDEPSLLWSFLKFLSVLSNYHFDINPRIRTLSWIVVVRNKNRKRHSWHGVLLCCCY